MPRISVALGLALSFGPAAMEAQVLCSPPKDSHEAQLFAALSVPLAFSLVEAPGGLAPGAVRLGLEGTYLPNIDQDIRTSTICRPGKGPENTDLLSAFPRPRGAVGLPGGLRLEVSWIPPIRLNQVKSNLVGLSLERGVPVGGRGIGLTVRAHGTFGLIQGPFTCDDENLRDPASECFQGTRSDDRYHPNIFGLEGALGWSLGGGRVRPFLGGGVNLLHPRFQVNFTNQFGVLDNTRVRVNRTRGVLFGGATWMAAPRLGLSGQIYSSPGDEVTGRVTLNYLIRP